MESKLRTGRTGQLIVVAALLGVVLGSIAYITQSTANDLATATRSVRTHDQVVSWPNHSSIQRAAVGYVGAPEGLASIRSQLTEPEALQTIEAKALGDPASIDITATATNQTTADAAVAAAVDLVVSESLEETRQPKQAEVEAFRDNLIEAEATLDDLLSPDATPLPGQLEGAAGTVSVLRMDLARAEAQLDALTAPLVAVGPQPARTDSRTRSALAVGFGVFLVSLLGLSVFGATPQSRIDERETIDLRDPIEAAPEQMAVAGVNAD